MKILKTLGMPVALLVSALLFGQCSDENNPKVRVPDRPEKPIVILYENDVHCAVDGYAKLVALRKLQQETTPYVSTVSCGDFVSGNIVGLASEGEQIVKIMNEVGYDAVVFGNHELDYGMPQMLKLAEQLEAPVVCANLQNTQTQKFLFPAYHTISYGDVDIAYIGFTTTTNGTKNALSDENGNLVYSFMKNEFYQNAQNWIDDARKKGADYVVALCHLGDMDRGNGHPSSLSLISNTKGIDAVIDGHDHHVIEQKMVENKEGKQVLLTSSGTAFKYVGKLVLTTEGKFESSLTDIHHDDALVDEETQKQVASLVEEAKSGGKEVIAYNEALLSIYDEARKRIVRKQETGLANLIADSYRHCTQSDIAMVNGGGVRADLKQGDVTINDLYTVLPFGDMIYKANISGKHLLDVLEFSVSHLPNEDGTFMQVSGLKFTVDSTIPTPAVMDLEQDIFTHVGEGERRVSDVQIWDESEKKYKPLDVSRTYTMASLDYLLLDKGGSAIFNHVDPIEDYWGADVEIVANYIQRVLNGKISASYALPEGRIVIRP